MYRGTGVSRGVRRTTWERSLKIWELQIPCFEEFWGGENVLGLVPAVSLTLWDTPVLFTPPLPLPQIWGEFLNLVWRIAEKFARKFLSEFLQRDFPTNISALFLQGFRPPPQKVMPKMHTQNCWHSSLISHLSRTQSVFHADFLLIGEIRKYGWVFWDAPLESGGNKRDKLKGTNAQFFAVFR